MLWARARRRLSVVCGEAGSISVKPDGTAERSSWTRNVVAARGLAAESPTKMKASDVDATSIAVKQKVTREARGVCAEATPFYALQHWLLPKYQAYIQAGSQLVITCAKIKSKIICEADAIVMG